MFSRSFISRNNLKLIRKYSNVSSKQQNTFLSEIQKYPFYYTYYIPCFIGAGIGGIFGSIEGFKRTHKDTIFMNCISTFGEGCVGICIGFYGGLLWPLTISVMIARHFYKEIKEEEKEEK